MNNSLDKALYYLTGNGNIDVKPDEELEKLVDAHPFFPVAHFLLSKKLKEQNSPRFLSQVQKTALYFPNPYWLHYQLLNDLPQEPIIYDNEGAVLGNEVEVIEDRDADTIEDIFGDSDVADKDNLPPQHPIVYDNEPIEDETENVISGAEEDRSTLPPDPGKDVDEHPITIEFTLAELDASSALAHETLGEQNEPHDIKETGPSTFKIETSLISVIIPNETRSAFLTSAIDEPIDALTQDLISHEQNELPIQAEEEVAAITRDTDESATEFLKEVTEERQENNVINTEEATPGYSSEGEEDEHEKMFQNIKAMLDASADEANAGIKSTIVPIDPYYTIDYFAAQGIKLDLEKNPQDKLGKQVKKFTQWLKHMKKLGPEDALAAEGPTQAETEAQQIADASNIAREVVTEAMALVLEKQGKKDKAIQLYRKLTFLNPHKSAYFADKINHLKGL